MRPSMVLGTFVLTSMLLQYVIGDYLDSTGQQSYAPMPYEYAYGVSHPYTGDVKEHKERTSKEGRTEGEYRWLQPNGLFRVVRYYVEGPSGFIAEVTEEEGPEIENYVSNSLTGENRKPVYDDSFGKSSYQGSTSGGYGTGGQRGNQYGATASSQFNSGISYGATASSQYNSGSSYGATASSQFNSGSSYGTSNLQGKSSYGSQSVGSAQGYSSSSMGYGAKRPLSPLNQLSRAQLGLSNQFARKQTQQYKSTNSYGNTKKSRKFSSGQGYGKTRNAFKKNQFSKSTLNTYGNIINSGALNQITPGNVNYGSGSGFRSKGSSYGQTDIKSKLIQSNSYANNLQTGLKSNIKVIPLTSLKNQLINPQVVTPNIVLTPGKQMAQYSSLSTNQGSKNTYDQGSVVKAIQTKYSSSNSVGTNNYNSNIQQSYTGNSVNDYTPQQEFLPPQNSYNAPKNSHDASQNIIPSHIIYETPETSYAAPQDAYTAPLKADLTYQAPGTILQTPQDSYLPPTQSYELSKQNVAQVSLNSYEAPETGYQTPQNSYQAPNTGYQTSLNSYQAPSTGYQTPQNSYQAPTSGHQTQQNNYQAPSTGYQTPQNSYQVPTTDYQTPQNSYQTPQNSYQAPTADYQTSQNSYQTPTIGYQSPQNSHQAPTNNHESPNVVSNSYQAPTNSYESPKVATNSYQAPTKSYESPKVATNSYQSPTKSYESPQVATNTLDNSYQAPQSIYEIPQSSYLPPSPTIPKGKDGLISHIPAAGNAGILKLEGEGSLSTSYGPPDW